MAKIANISVGGQNPVRIMGILNTSPESFYKKSIIIDGLIIPKGWNDESFQALDDSGYTGFSASLSSRNFQVAMSSLLEWNEKIKQNSNKLILANGSKDFFIAKMILFSQMTISKIVGRITKSRVR